MGGRSSLRERTAVDRSVWQPCVPAGRAFRLGGSSSSFPVTADLFDVRALPASGQPIPSNRCNSARLMARTAVAVHDRRDRTPDAARLSSRLRKRGGGGGGARVLNLDVRRERFPGHACGRRRCLNPARSRRRGSTSRVIAMSMMRADRAAPPLTRRRGAARTLLRPVAVMTCRRGERAHHGRPIARLAVYARAIVSHGRAFARDT